jgi:cellulose synthase/poly-beta-1,6-N-acetylglucosamine synthase-like glycosyltransferase
MKENRGHARCIASGLKYIFKKKEFDFVIPMDGDGEDRPEEIKNFIQLSEQSGEKSIAGERVKRSEGLFFQFCYKFHKFLTLAFTGQSIKFGNFTCLSKSTVKKMLEEKATWNSFSGSLKKIEKDLISIPSIRGKRYFGPSQMSFFNLLKHSLSIISVFRKTVLIRSALFIVFYILLIKSYASIITSLPLVLLLIMIYSISSLALRENIDEFNNSLTNIHDIEKIK